MPIFFTKTRRTVLELNSLDPYQSSEREIKFRGRLFTSSIKCKIGQFHVVVVQKTVKKCIKKV